MFSLEEMKSPIVRKQRALIAQELQVHCSELQIQHCCCNDPMGWQSPHTELVVSSHPSHPPSVPQTLVLWVASKACAAPASSGINLRATDSAESAGLRIPSSQ